jgi:hypothetical protein
MPHRIVAVFPSPEFEKRKRLFGAFEALYGLRFIGICNRTTPRDGDRNHFCERVADGSACERMRGEHCLRGNDISGGGSEIGSKPPVQSNTLESVR